MNQQPSVRPLEAVPVETDGKNMVSLNDPDRLSDMSMLVSLPTYYLMTLMDGTRSAVEICDEFYRQFSQRVPMEEVSNLITTLDEAMLLDNQRFRDKKEAVRRAFLSSPKRPAFLAGKSYPDNSGELAGHLDELLGNGARRSGGPVESIIVPHIDFRVGGGMMAAGWRELAGSGTELVIILGTGHTLADDFFACIDKDFTTPVGTMSVDRAFLAALERNFGEDIYTQAQAHRNEHSIEFQSLFFARLFEKRPEMRAVPILLSFPEMIWDFDHPVFNGARLNRFIDALKKTAEEDGRRIAYVASVDFSHVGARFGDPAKLTGDALKRIESDDRDLIDALATVDGDRFIKKIQQTNRNNRVCGFPPLLTLLRLTNARRGDLIDYRQNIEGDMETMVSFATMTLRR